MDSAGTYSNMGKGCGYGKTCTPMEPVPGICPDGWHLPSDAEIDSLYRYVDADVNGAYDLKSQFGWAEGGSDMYGFSAVPAGWKQTDGAFVALRDNVAFWSYSECRGSETTHADDFYFESYDNDFHRTPFDKSFALSVRCVKTEPVPAGISSSDLIWYGGNRLKDENMLVQTNYFKDYIWAKNANQPSITFGTKVVDGSIPDPLILHCGGGICGRVRNVVDGEEPGFGFDISDEVTDVTDWGGICVTYTATNDSLSLYLGTGGSNSEFSQSISFDFYRVYLPKAEKATTKCYDWTKFKQRGSGSPVKLDVYLPKVHEVSFQFREETGNMTFNIIAVGKYTAGQAVYDAYMADKANTTSAWDYLSEAHASQYVQFPDNRDGQIYKSIQIDNQTWMAENLNYDTTGSSCYDNDSLNCKVYGRLYTWEAAMSACPDGWMLPSKADWDALLNAAAAGSTSSKAMKSSHPLSGWDIEDPGTDAVGFSSLPGGEFTPGEGFVHMNDYAFFWTATIAFDDNVETAYWNDIDNNGANIGFRSKENGFSVRCIKTGSKYNATANTLTDFRDNKVYETVEIGDQVWMAENLNYVYPGKTADEDSSSFCFNNVGDNCGEYGRLYMWSAAMDSAGLVSGNVANGCGYGTTCSASEKHRGVCPAGWHLPSEEEFGALISAVGGAPAGLKTTSGWYNGGDGTNSSGFSAKPSSYRGSNGYYGMAASDACFWSSTERGDGARTFDVYLSYDSGSGLGTGGAGEDKRYSCAVRCVKD